MEKCTECVATKYIDQSKEDCSCEEGYYFDGETLECEQCMNGC